MTRPFASPEPLQAPHKNIVICLDGTGNRFEACNSNVVKLFQVCVRDHSQNAYYDPGVGTLGDTALTTSLGRLVNKALGNAFGVGLMKNVEEAYAYLMEHHEEGDRIFLFGFSRGAFSARVLAGFINRCGLFEKGCQNLIPYAMESYLEQLGSGVDAQATRDHYKLRSSFRRTFGRRFKDDSRAEGVSRQTPIHFLGLWDTVKSYGRLYNPSYLPRESTNESVGIIRHAIALDEKRVFFPQMHWRRKGEGQQLREVWFAGVHGDVGGTPSEPESGLSKMALDWMLGHAFEAGLLIDHQDYLRIVHGIPEKADADLPAIARPDPAALRHESLTGWWWLIEVLPWRRNDGPSDGALVWWRGRRTPERMRVVPGSAVIHGGTIERIAHAKERYQAGTLDAPYRPGQLPPLSDAMHGRLSAGLPVLTAEPGAQAQRLLLPLPDGSGEVLMHVLSDAESKAWPTAGCDDCLQALRVLALATSQAMGAALRTSLLNRMVLDMIETTRQAPRLYADLPAAGRLEAPALPAAGAAGSSAKLADEGLALHRPASMDAQARLKRRLDEARSVLGTLSRWTDEVEPGSAASPSAADPCVGVLGLWRRLAGSAPVGRLPDALARIDVLLDAFERTLQAGVARLASGVGSAAAVAASAPAEADTALDADLLAHFEAALQAWIALRALSGAEPGPDRRVHVPGALARRAVLGAAGAKDAANRITQLRGQLEQVRKLRACGDGCYLAVAQALLPDEAAQKLADRFKAMASLVDWPAEFAKAYSLLVAGAPGAAAPAAEPPAPQAHARSLREWAEARSLAQAQAQALALELARARAAQPPAEPGRDGLSTPNAGPGATAAPKPSDPGRAVPAQGGRLGKRPAAPSTVTAQLDKVMDALHRFDTLVGRMALLPEQRDALNGACGHLQESLVTWADRLR